MGILKNDGYITVTSGNILLTEKGYAKASAVFERHRLITQFLEITLGIDHSLAEQDACRMEHIINKKPSRKSKNMYSPIDSNPPKNYGGFFLQIY